MPQEAWTPVGIINFLPTSLFNLLSSPVGATVIEAGFIASAICCIVGFKWNVFRWIILALTIVTFGIRNSYGHAFRSELILILAQFVVVGSQANHALSHDARNELRRASDEYDWPIRALRLLWVLVFFAGGLSKLRNSGFNWITDNYLYEYLIANQVTRAGVLSERSFADLGPLLAANKDATLVLGALVLGFELLYPLILFRKFRSSLLIGTLLFQIAVFFLLGVNFFFYLPLVFIWSDSVVEKTISRLSGRGRLNV